MANISLDTHRLFPTVKQAAIGETQQRERVKVKL